MASVIRRMDNLRIRKAQLTDLFAIAAVNLSAFGSTSHPYSLRQNFDLFNDTYLVAELDNQVIGYCLAAIRPGTEEGWILDLAVLSELQGSGIGRQLTKSACELLCSRGVKLVYLTADPNKVHLRKFYESFGFNVERQEADYFGPGKNRLVMRTTLY